MFLSFVTTFLFLFYNLGKYLLPKNLTAVGTIEKNNNTMTISCCHGRFFYVR